MSYIIIGAGIAGLYSAYKLHKELGVTQITIFEKANRPGGRIETILVDDIHLEMGAGRIATVHNNVLNLVRELGLENDLTEGSNGKSIIVFDVAKDTSKKYGGPIHTNSIYNITDTVSIEKTDFYTIMDQLNANLSDPKFNILAKNVTLFHLIEQIYDIDKANQLRLQFGYDDDFLKQNAISGLMAFKFSFASTTKYRGLKNGLSQIITKLVNYLEGNGIKIKYEKECLDIIKHNNQYQCIFNDTNVITDNIICAIPKINLEKFSFFKKIQPMLDMVTNISLMRIYAFFPKKNGKIWFDHINTAVTVNDTIRQLIPIDKEKGIIMVYCDSDNAKYWNYSSESQILRYNLMFHLRRLFSQIDIPEPTQIYLKYHDTAAHIWKPTVDYVESANKIIRPFPEENIFVVGEAFAETQQWSEGALQTVNSLITKLKNK